MTTAQPMHGGIAHARKAPVRRRRRTRVRPGIASRTGAVRADQDRQRQGLEQQRRPEGRARR
ncbi:hypothetical protein CURTO8I2_170225 [Curtobacterium sp. 8I-2]|nr:hypothetical protein CURTO8I2_170225 [Curtobacterium sp. 8I-2]